VSVLLHAEYNIANGSLLISQMKPEFWEILGNTATAQSIVGVSIGKVAYNMIQLRYPSAESLLEACSKHIEMIKTRFNEVTADRRECIRAAVERNECKSLERLEEDLQRYGLTCVSVSSTT
jgi:hypothetical protein